MAKHLKPDTKEKILAEWKAGYTQNRLAKEYEVSPATINKICKGIVQENLEIVNTQVAINRALEQKTEYEVNSIHSLSKELFEVSSIAVKAMTKGLKSTIKSHDDIINDEGKNYEAPQKMFAGNLLVKTARDVYSTVDNSLKNNKDDDENKKVEKIERVIID